MPKTKESKLAKIVDEATKNASRALTKLAGEKVIVEVTKLEIREVQKRFPDIEPEQMVAAVYLPITGEVKVASLLIFPKETAHTLCDVLMRRKPEVTARFSELDESAIKEVGNIICGNLLTVFANTLQVKIIEHVPSFSFDMLGAVVDVVTAEFAQKTKSELVIEVKFIFKHAKIDGYVVLIFGFEEMQAIMKALEVGGGLILNRE